MFCPTVALQWLIEDRNLNLFIYLFIYYAFISLWDFSHGQLGSFPRGKTAATESRYPTHGAWWVFQCVHNPPNSNADCRIFNVCTDVNACDCTWGFTDTRKRVCTESGLWEKNPLLHRGFEPASAACQSDALPTELHPYVVQAWSTPDFDESVGLRTLTKV